MEDKEANEYSGLRTLGVMRRDAMEVARAGYFNLREASLDFGWDLANAPRNISRFGMDLLNSYAGAQVQSTIGTQIRYRDPEFFSADLGGVLVGAAQDTLMIGGTMSYFDGSDEMYAKVAAIATGAKLVSNLAAKTIRWGISARKRSIES